MERCAELEKRVQVDECVDDELALLAADCPPELARNVLVVLESAVRDKFGPVHIVLAQHCAKNNLTSQQIHLFAAPARPADNAHEYFAAASQVKLKERQWHEAAVHAAISLSLYPSIERYRQWALLELVARGKVRTLPRAAWTSQSCSVTDQFSRFFDSKRWGDWEALSIFVREHLEEFEEWGVVQLVQRARATYAVQLILDSMQYVSQAPLHTFVAKLSNEISVSQLMAAGLADECSISADERVNQTVKPGRSTDSAALLELAAQFS